MNYNSFIMSINMEYNSHREPLIISEYGRHIQKLIEFAVTIENKEERQTFAEMIVELMSQVIPPVKPSKEVTERLWNHLFRIADYKLEVEPPESIVIVTKEKRKKAVKLDYPNTDPKYRHYGYYVQQLVDKASQIEDEAKRKSFAVAIGSYMKMAMRTWSHEQYINDEMIKNDLRTLSEKKLDLDDRAALDYNLAGGPVQRKKKVHKALSPSMKKAKKRKRQRKVTR